MAKTIAQINEKIKKGKVVVVTAEEMKKIVRAQGLKQAAKKVDVVTTATFGPMCSSGVYFNIKQAKPKIKLGGSKVFLNRVEAYGGFAAADIFIGATALPLEGPRNSVYPGEFKYGGAHVIEDLVKGKDIKLEASAYGTDCYPLRKLETLINIKDINEATLFNIRNMYQNYNAAVNLSNKVIYTYMGTLRPNLGNITYCSAGQLSPFLNDPLYKVIGIGTRIFLGGGIGYIAWQGTQHNPLAERAKNKTPIAPGATAAVIGGLKQMSSNWLKGTSFRGYGTTLSVGIGVPIPIINEEMAKYTSVRDEEIFTQVIDYSKAYPQGKKEVVAKVSYAELKSGSVKISGKKIPTASISSYFKATEICRILKKQIKEGNFFLTEPVAPIPAAGSA
ncbi:MAG: homocysteine biosynthesis protein [Candidatus Omnitrophota bacterium]